MILAIVGFLSVSLALYTLLAGADFGAGILEIFSKPRYRKDDQNLIHRAMGPVWEANHIWIILALVIVFTAFPPVFRQLSLSFHIPLSLMLVGIIARGCAFSFRHYDAYQDKSQVYYSAVFSMSSFFTPLLLGVVAGGMMVGQVDPSATDFDRAYVRPWLNSFSFNIGFFLCGLSAFLSSVYLIGETTESVVRKRFLTRAKVANAFTIIMGGLCFVTAQVEGYNLYSAFLESWPAVVALLVATFLLVPLWNGLLHGNPILTRALAAAQVLLILLGWFATQYPILIRTSPEYTGPGFSLYEVAAPESTLKWLLIALVLGSLLIFPALYFLFKTFKLGLDRPSPRTLS